MRCTKYGSRGFTLIEVLLAITLFSIVIVSCYGIFSMGIQIWKRTQGPLRVERKAVVTLERMGKDIRSTFLTEHESLASSGNSRQFLLPSFVTVANSQNPSQIQYGLVGYKWIPGKKELCRSIMSATDLYHKKKPHCRVLVTDVEKLRFEYWLFQKFTKSYSWYDRWDSEEGLPQAVRVTMTLRPQIKGKKYAARKEYVRTFMIPAGGAVS